jgi:molybdopterin/thiamine biosynthesis adenylyltransferase/nitroreductase
VFDYQKAFSRNIGWVTEQEQAVLRDKRVAIAGLGGVGGSHLLTLTRLGVGAFNLSDYDSFELANFNRQAGAALSSVGSSKLDILMSRALDINPELDIRCYAEGINGANVHEFLADADLYLDGLDFFAVDARCDVFSACNEQGIPAVTAAPLGMGVAVLNFLPGEMNFEEYFGLQGQSEQEQLLRFLLGLSPAMLQRGYLVDPGAVDFSKHRGPSTPMACNLCAGVAATQVLKILLGRGKVRSAPHGFQFDAYRDKTVHTWRPGGNRNLLQRIGLVIARRQLARMGRSDEAESMVNERNPVELILEQARWAPSGDNTQPWQFEIIDSHHFVVHGEDTRNHCVYDLQGHASQLSIGALLENIDIAASGHGLKALVSRRPGLQDTHPTFDIELIQDEDVERDILAPFIVKRSVQRRPMRLRSLLRSERDALESALPSGYKVLWLEDLKGRVMASRLAFKSAGLRLTLPEAYPTHRDVIDWEHAEFSKDRIPAKAVGFDPLMLRLTRWAMTSWSRVSFLNRYLGGTLLPRIQLDIVPGIFCAAHFVLYAPERPGTVEEFVAAGRAMQRFWLTATSLGLNIQPGMTPLIFHEYGMDGIRFSSVGGMYERAQDVSGYLQKLIGPEVSECAVFMGRIGAGNPPKSRSVRMPLAELVRGEEVLTQQV